MNWIKVEDFKPKEDERVLVYRPNMGDLGISVVWGWTVLNRAGEKGITHWMALPKNPDGE